MKVLVLFAGKGSISNVAREMGHEVCAVDWEPYEGIDIQMDIGKLKMKHLPWIPDMVWASPDCGTYSMASGNKHRDINYQPKTEYAEFCDTVNKNWLKLVAKLQKANTGKKDI